GPVTTGPAPGAKRLAPAAAMPPSASPPVSSRIEKSPKHAAFAGVGMCTMSGSKTIAKVGDPTDWLTNRTSVTARRGTLNHTVVINGFGTVADTGVVLVTVTRSRAVAASYE